MAIDRVPVISFADFRVPAPGQGQAPAGGRLRVEGPSTRDAQRPAEQSPPPAAESKAGPPRTSDTGPAGLGGRLDVMA